MNKSIITIIMVVAATFSLAATDLFHVKDFTINRGETVQVEILLDNETQYTAFQADLYLPEGLSADLESFALTNRHGEGHNIAARIQADGSIRLMSYSMKLKPYSGADGTLVTFNATASETMTLPATINLKHVLFTRMSDGEASLPDSESTVFLRFDVNNDRVVSINDVTHLINHLLIADEFIVQGDVNQDENVNINDVTALINILLTSN